MRIDMLFLNEDVTRYAGLSLPRSHWTDTKTPWEYAEICAPQALGSKSSGFMLILHSFATQPLS